MSQDTYSLPVACINCDWQGDITLKKGEEFNILTIKFGSSNNCPHCGCNTLTKRHTPKWDSDKFYMRNLGDDRLLCMVGDDYKNEKQLVGAINE